MNCDLTGLFVNAYFLTVLFSRSDFSNQQGYIVALICLVVVEYIFFYFKVG